MEAQQGNIYQWQSVFFRFPFLLCTAFTFAFFIFNVGRAGQSWMLACEVGMVSGRKFTLAALPC